MSYAYNYLFSKVRYIISISRMVLYSQQIKNIFMENLHRYWCFACQNHFQTQKQTGSCSLCHSGAIQLSEGNNSDPSQFAAYQIPRPNQQQPQPQTQQENQNQDEGPFFNAFFTISQFGSPFGFPPIVRRQIRIVHFIDPMEMFNPFGSSFGEQGIINLLTALRGQGNLVPATQQEKNRLEKVQKVNECTVCQEEETDESRKGYKLPCGHSFHIDCLDPWLERTNTCPTCRAHI